MKTFTDTGPDTQSGESATTFDCIAPGTVITKVFILRCRAVIALPASCSLCRHVRVVARLKNLYYAVVISEALAAVEHFSNPNSDATVERRSLMTDAFVVAAYT